MISESPRVISGQDWAGMAEVEFVLTTDERNDPAKLTQNYPEVIKKVVEDA